MARKRIYIQKLLEFLNKGNSEDKIKTCCTNSEQNNQSSYEHQLDGNNEKTENNTSDELFASTICI